MAEIHHEIKVRAEPDRIRKAVSNPADLEAWYGGKVSLAGGVVRFDFADDAPTFRWRVEAVSPNEILWKCVQGPGDAVGTEASFRISGADKGRELIQFVHRGWPHTGGNFRKCNTQWAVLLHHLRQFLESGKAAPALNAPA
ncbi:MAG: hypothetical protein JOY71_30555 [Acetobacteraceae bacterium]|nr:hypothetical protein [Acetobacteraceae bacterium]MBV8526406.1 hypothetical protein [Acetobacteraceae bacterium]